MSSLFDFIPLDEMGKNINIAVRNSAIQIGKEINHEFTLSIMEFYRSYAPKRGRTASMYQFAQGVGGKNVFYKRMDKARYIAGIDVDPSFYGGNPYEKRHGWTNVDPSFVFDLSYIRGIHGFTADMVSGHNETLDITNRMTWKPKVIPGATTPPDTIMETKFENKFTQGYVQSVFEKYFNAL